MNMHATRAAHPLDPLSGAEIEAAMSILRAQETLPAKLRVASVELVEPTRAELRAWREGEAPRLPRRAFAVMLDGATGRILEATVDLDASAVLALDALDNLAPPYGQPAVAWPEIEALDAKIKADPAWRAAVMKRGVREEEIATMQIDPFSSGYFGRDYEKGRRIVRAVAYLRMDMRGNAYAHPVDGVVAVYDMVEERIVRLVDAEKVVPVPRTQHRYDRVSQPAREGLRPLDIVQREGPSFAVDGWKVEWQGWSFRLGFTAREGLVIHELGIRDRGRLRPVIHRASVTEMVVPYADPTENHYWKSAFDAGEYGLGKLANALELGCDCLGHIHYFDVTLADAAGAPMEKPNAICMHEEDFGILWKHDEPRQAMREVRRSRRLVISFFATVGNYDYGFYWHLYQDGTIQLEAKLTGIIQTSAVAPGDAYEWGGMVTPEIGGPTHQHFFNVRLHMDVDGGPNSITEHDFVPRPMGPGNPYGNVFDAKVRTIRTEMDTDGIARGETGRYWKVINPAARNAVGRPTGYKLVAMPAPVMLADPGATVRQRGGFATRHVWVTPFDPAERYASGDYPNNHAGGDGLPRYCAQDRPVENADLVLWHSFGHTHFCKPEDFPVMPVEYAGFHLKPNGFFDANPAMDLAPDRNAASRDARDASCCAAPETGGCCGG